MNPASLPPDAATRREFLKASATAATAAALTRAIEVRAHAADDGTLDLALVGCGGRGTGAIANALSTAGPTRLVAMADVLPDRLGGSHETLTKQFPERIEVPPDRRFLGFDAYKRAIDALPKNGIVVLTTPPAFRPWHLAYAVERGVNVFMEKSFAVDPPGVRRVMQAGRVAQQKGLKIAGGLMSRHSRAIEETVRQIHAGAIGEVILTSAYRMHGTVGFQPKRAGETELAHQIRNYSNFTWLNGSFLLDWLIHNLDVCCMVKDAWPVSAQGQAARRVRTEPDQLFDQYFVEYGFPDGTRMIAQGRHMNSCHDHWGCVIHGTKGMAELGEGVSKPRLFRGHRMQAENLLWQWREAAPNAYQEEWDRFIKAIRENLPYNETDRCARAAMVGVLGRLAVESGKEVTWDEALASEVELAPGLDSLKSLDGPAPVEPDAQGRYPLPVPGVTRVV
ncbi:MAG: Gfo/Idh/MocA family oxidoreductase [Verrucomicrobiales bacterium]|nr:Gfo/Idh/MocA family oxidoreductase [Verrucomicrobiales bacterium]